jgi:TAP-like protein
MASSNEQLRLTEGVPDFQQWMGITGNALDYSYSSQAQIPRILWQFASYCVGAATMDPKYCPLASPSMTSPDPVSDIISRIDYIVANVTSKVGVVDTRDDGKVQRILTFSYLSNVLESWLRNPWAYGALADTFVQYETAILANISISSITSSNKIKRSLSGRALNYSSLPQNDSLAGFTNPFASDATACLDLGFNGISDVQSFVDYFFNQLSVNPVIAYPGIKWTKCLSWPNLTSLPDVERFNGTFPKELKNRMLLIGITNNPTTPLTNVISTYNFLGANNAALLVHDGFGHYTFSNPNNCTTAMIKAFLTNGT